MLQYFVPGFVGLQVFKFCASKKIKDKFEIVLCCVLSYIANALCELIYEKWPNISFLSSIYGKVVLSCVGLILICILCALILRQKWFENILVSLFHVSPKSDLLDGVLDTPDAANIRVYLKGNGGSVYGHYAGRDDDSTDPWIAISEPTVYSKDGNGKNYKKGFVYLIRIADVDHMIVD